MNATIHPPIRWKYYIVYWKLPDGRMYYFRGQERRRKLFIRNLIADWVTEPELARLFEDKPTFGDEEFAKKLQNDPVRKKVQFKGFDGIVLRSHLIIPSKPIKRRPPG